MQTLTTESVITESHVLSGISSDTLTKDIPDSTVLELPSDFPPESFWLSKDAEFDWFDRNAFLDRKDSTKGSFNHLNHFANPSHSNSSSQRYSVNTVNSKSKAAIIGLLKTQNTTFVDSKRRQCKPVNVRLFPMRSYSIGKARTTVPVEPSSPKVSCIGRVRSKKCRSRRKTGGQPNEPVKSASLRSRTSKSSRSSRAHKSGLLSRLTSLFRSDNNRRRKTGKPAPEKFELPPEITVPVKICVSVKPVSSEPATPSGPPALGSLIRFASGHRAECLVGSG
ncbi:uncharacterized protein LOC143554894 [Bidens hawaiensis]|uniref:uncharacterized protein LOC143554894 n=1 Tax=Bidens hawaiensis TaxID=980011 RepID=UPI00404AD43A